MAYSTSVSRRAPCLRVSVTSTATVMRERRESRRKHSGSCVFPSKTVVVCAVCCSISSGSGNKV